jgi:hypothetical protein
MKDNDSFLVMSILRKAYSSEVSAAKLNPIVDFLADPTCRVLERLGLVEKKASCTLGFKPTHRLINIIADRMVKPTTRSKNPVANVDHDFVDRLWQLANDVDEEEAEVAEQEPVQPTLAEQADGEAKSFCCQVLVVLGLLKKGADGYMPTRLIHNLILETCFPLLSTKH